MRHICRSVRVEEASLFRSFFPQERLRGDDTVHTTRYKLTCGCPWGICSHGARQCSAVQLPPEEGVFPAHVHPGGNRRVGGCWLFADQEEERMIHLPSSPSYGGNTDSAAQRSGLWVGAKPLPTCNTEARGQFSVSTQQERDARWVWL